MALLSLSQVSKRFGDIRAVDDVSFSVDRGEVVGFLGPNGAGKTTTMRLVTGFLEPDAGRVELDGRPVDEDSLESRRRIGYLPETTPLYRDMLVDEYLHHVAALRGLDGPERERRIDAAVARTGIEDVYYRPVEECSKGFRQRVGLAQAILTEPDLLILDEPTEGLDPNQRVEIRDLVTSLGEERTVVLSTHVMQEVQLTCGRLLVIHEGSLVADGPVDGILSGDGGRRVVAEVEADAREARAGLEGLEGVEAVELLEQGEGRSRFRVAASGDRDLRPRLFDLAADRGWRLWELRSEEESLEDVFRELTAPGR